MYGLANPYRLSFDFIILCGEEEYDETCGCTGVRSCSGGWEEAPLT